MQNLDWSFRKSQGLLAEGFDLHQLEAAVEFVTLQ